MAPDIVGFKFCVRGVRFGGTSFVDVHPAWSLPVAIEWSGTPGNFTGPKQLITDTTLGSSCPAHVYARAPKQSVADMWFSDAATGDAILVIDAPRIVTGKQIGRAHV